MPEFTLESPAHPQRVKVRLRVSPSDATEIAERLRLPTALQDLVYADRTALWLAPEQWLLLSDRRSAIELVDECATALAGRLHLAVDVSAALGCITLRGARVRELLAMGSGLDWSVRPAQRCVRTRFARLPVIVHTAIEDYYDLYFDRSFQAWLETWLAHALRDPLLHENP
jgi:heterotetrameric sarcosine oxidase gamma subunit